MAAVMSTSDSLLMQAGTILSRDIYQRYIDKKADHRRMVLVSRLLILLVGIVGVVVAAVEPPTVFDLVIFGFGVLGNSFIVPYVASVSQKSEPGGGDLLDGARSGNPHCLDAGGVGERDGDSSLYRRAVVLRFGNAHRQPLGKDPSQGIQDAVEEAKHGRKISGAVDRHSARELAPEALNIARHLREHRLIPVRE